MTRVSKCKGQRFAALHQTQQENNKSSDQSAAAAEPKPASTPNNIDNNNKNTTCPTCGAISINKNYISTSPRYQVVDITSPQAEITHRNNLPQPPIPFGDDGSLADINAFLNLNRKPIYPLNDQVPTSKTILSPIEDLPIERPASMVYSPPPRTQSGVCASLLPHEPPLQELNLQHPSPLTTTTTTTKTRHALSPSATILTTDDLNMNLNDAAGGRGYGLGDRNRNRGKTVLHMSAERGNMRLVELLLNHGVDVDGTDSYGHTALHYAAGRAHVEIVARLLAAGADPELRNHEGISPLHAAAHVECEPVIELLRRAGADLNAGIGVASSNSSANEGMARMEYW